MTPSSSLSSSSMMLAGLAPTRFCFMSSGPRSPVETVPTHLGSGEAFRIGLRFGSCVQSRESVMSSAGIPGSRQLGSHPFHKALFQLSRLPAGQWDLVAPPFCTKTPKGSVPPRGPRSGAAAICTSRIQSCRGACTPTVSEGRSWTPRNNGTLSVLGSLVAFGNHWPPLVSD